MATKQYCLERLTANFVTHMCADAIKEHPGFAVSLDSPSHFFVIQVNPGTFANYVTEARKLSMSKIETLVSSDCSSSNLHVFRAREETINMREDHLIR